jgi:recombination protein RecT
MNENMIQKAQKTQMPDRKRLTMQDYIKRMQGEIAKALPSVLTPERFTRITLSALSSNPTLQQCSPKSFLGAMMTAAQLGMEPNTPLGQAYLIPYKNHGKEECQFQLGYKGLIDLAYRSGQVSTISAQTVYENDTFEYEMGLEPKLRHIPAKADHGNPVYFYAVFRTKDGGYGFEVMSVEDARAHARRFSKAYNSGPWQTNFEEMAKKTVLKKALKYAPLKSDFVRALSADETIKTEISDDMFSEPDETVIEAEGYAVDEATGEVTGEADLTPQEAAEEK